MSLISDDFQYLASTKGSSSALFGGRSCTCVVKCTSLEPFVPPLFFFFVVHFMVYCGNCD